MEHYPDYGVPLLPLLPPLRRRHVRDRDRHGPHGRLLPLLAAHDALLVRPRPLRAPQAARTSAPPTGISSMMEVCLRLHHARRAASWPRAGDPGRRDPDALRLRRHQPRHAGASSDAGAAWPLGLLFFLVGFGIKAGMWPFGQLWLPDAHPAAPSPVSALLSGVMIKTGVYGLHALVPLAGPGRGGLPTTRSEPGASCIAVLGTVTLFVGTHAGPEAGGDQAAPRLPHHRPGGLHPPGSGARASRSVSRPPRTERCRPGAGRDRPSSARSSTR